MTRGRVSTGLVRLIARAIKSLTWSGWYPSMYNYLSLLNIHHDMLNKVQVLIIFIRRTVNTCLLSLVLLSKGLEEAIITLSLWHFKLAIPGKMHVSITVISSLPFKNSAPCSTYLRWPSYKEFFLHRSNYDMLYNTTLYLVLHIHLQLQCIIS